MTDIKKGRERKLTRPKGPIFQEDHVNGRKAIDMGHILDIPELSILI